MAQAQASNGLRDALRAARVAEAAHLEAQSAIRDSKSLRLQVLKLDVDAAVASSPDAQRNFDVALSPGDPPKLWIDAITSVAMEPDFRTYRLTLETQSGRETLAETTDRQQMLEEVKRLMAHRIISRERQIAATAPQQPFAARYSASALVLAWLAGVMLGVLGLLAAGIYMKLI